MGLNFNIKAWGLISWILLNILLTRETWISASLMTFKTRENFHLGLSAVLLSSSPNKNAATHWCFNRKNFAHKPMDLEHSLRLRSTDHNNTKKSTSGGIWKCGQGTFWNSHGDSAGEQRGRTTPTITGTWAPNAKRMINHMPHTVQHTIYSTLLLSPKKLYNVPHSSLL